MDTPENIVKPKGPFGNAESWIQEDKKWQLAVFKKTKRRPRLDDPTLKIFGGDAEVRAAAIAGRLLLCAKPEHLEPNESNDELRFNTMQGVYKNKTCKKCTCAVEKEKKDAVRAPAPMYEKAEDFMNANAPNEGGKFKEMTVGYCPRPVREQFKTQLEFDRALHLRDMHDQAYRRQLHQLEVVKKRNNETARDRYAANKETKEGREQLRKKLDRDNANKRKRMAAPVKEGNALCKIGPHLVDEHEVMFCPVADLGIVYKGKLGCIHRGICKKHFPQNLARMRRHNATAKRKEYNRVKELDPQVKEVRRKWRADNRLRYNEVRRIFFYSHPEAREKRYAESRAYHLVPQHAFCIRVSKTIWSAEKRGIAFKLSDERMREIFSLDATCFHCGVKAEGTRPLGPDRLEPTAKEYTDENTVTCCKLCNFSRGGLSLDAFRQACRNVVAYQEHGTETIEQIPYVLGNNNFTFRKGQSYEALMYAAKKKGFTVEITKEDHYHLQNESNCYLCGVKAILGVDRKDNTLGYLKSNSFPCCSSCNMMKRETAFDAFVARCKRVSALCP